MSAASSAALIGRMGVNDLVKRLRDLAPLAGDAAYWIVEAERHPGSECRRLSAKQALDRLEAVARPTETACNSAETEPLA